MRAVPDLPLWAAIPVAVLLVAGALLTAIGGLGLVRFRSFYERVHAPTLGTSYGVGCIAVASMICFTVLQSRLVIHELLIGVFLVMTTPVALMLVARAALHRDRQEGVDPSAPAAPGQEVPPPG